MNIAVKKIELIEWLARIQDKSLLRKLEALKKKAIVESYEARMKPKAPCRPCLRNSHLSDRPIVCIHIL